MTVEKMTRELGKVIQQDERYLSFQKARQDNEADTALNDLIGQINIIQMNYQREADRENADQAKMEEYDRQFRQLYAQVMANPHMAAYEIARKEVDAMMNYCMKILSLCVNGEDPETCEPEAESCEGECGSCGGCH